MRTVSCKCVNTNCRLHCRWSLTGCELQCHDARVVFIASTTGDGAFPDSALSFWRSLLRKELQGDFLGHLSFTCFGYGDTAYDKYNAAARKLWNRLLQLGAKAFCARGLGDDSSPRGLGAEGDLDWWLTTVLWPSLDSLCPMPPGFAQATRPLQLLPQYNVEIVTDSACIAETLEPERRCPYPFPLYPRAPGGSYAYAHSIPLSTDHHSEKVDAFGALQPTPLLAAIVGNDRMTSSHWSQDVRHLRMELPPCTRASLHTSSSWDAQLAWRAGDIAAVHPCNPATEVCAVAAALRLSVDTVVRVNILPGSSSQAAGTGDKEGGYQAAVCTAGQDGVLMPTSFSSFGPPHILPPVLSIGHLLSYYVDIAGVPRRGALAQLSLLARDDEQAEKLAEMSGAAGGDIYNSYCSIERRTLSEVLSDFSSIDALPLPTLLQLTPTLQPRYFSIASSPAGPGGTLDLCAAVVEYKTKRGRVKRGVCSTWLASLSVGTIVPVWIKAGTLPMPSLPSPHSCSSVEQLAEACSPAAPWILVGPGTGVAPMRAVVQELQAWWDAVLVHAPSLLQGHGEQGVRALAACRPAIYLFFGCRGRERDWLYGQEFCTAVGGAHMQPASVGHAPSQGVLQQPWCTMEQVKEHKGDAVPTSVLQLYEVAFSRDALMPAAAPADATAVIPSRVYVQSLMRRPGRAGKLGELLLYGRPGAQSAQTCAAAMQSLTSRQGVLSFSEAGETGETGEAMEVSAPARVFIAGSANKMPQEVTAALCDCVKAVIYRDCGLSPSGVDSRAGDTGLAEGHDGAGMVEAQAIQAFLGKWAGAMERAGRLIVEAWS